MLNVNINDTTHLSDSQLRLAMVLASFRNRDGSCYPKRSTILSKTGWSEDKLDRVKKAMIKAGYLSVSPRKNRDGSYTSNQYDCTIQFATYNAKKPNKTAPPHNKGIPYFLFSVSAPPQYKVVYEGRPPHNKGCVPPQNKGDNELLFFRTINTLSPAHEEVSKTDPLPTQTEPQENGGGKHADLPDEERRIMEAYDKVKSILDRYPATKDLWLNSAGLKWTHEQFDNELLAWIRHNASDHFLLNITRKYTKFPNWLKKAKQFAPSPKNSRVRQMNKKNDSKVIPEPSEEYMEKLRGMTMKEKLALAG